LNLVTARRAADEPSACEPSAYAVGTAASPTSRASRVVADATRAGLFLVFLVFVVVEVGATITSLFVVHGRWVRTRGLRGDQHAGECPGSLPARGMSETLPVAAVDGVR
jgi:hypothetical protein